MIEIIKGTVVERDDKSVTVLIGGMGIRVWTTNKVVSKTQVGENIQLFTDLNLRETEISLYGFDNAQERNMYRALLKVNGVGPKAAMAIISALTLSEINNAIQTNNSDRFARVPGIGKKTAQKLILFLQDSLDFENVIQLDPTTASINSDLMEALVGLGYSVIEAQSCIQSLPADTPDDLESKLRIALQHFS
jgi:Holliday junction DNA helicase RuvA